MSDTTIFNKTLGCIIANLISVDYNGFMEVEFRSIGNNYLANKCIQAAKAEQKVIDKLKIVDKEVASMIEERVKFYSDLIFDVLALDESKQKRMRNLVDKLKKEELKNG